MAYLCDAFGEETFLLVVVVVTGEHQLSVLEDPLHILLLVGGKLALLGESSHSLEAFLDFVVELSLVRGIGCFLVNGFDAADVILVEVVGEHRVGLTEIFPSAFEGTMLAY